MTCFAAYARVVPLVRALALAVIRRPGTSQIFVDEVVEPTTGLTFHRPAGGGIEFGEAASQTVVRELQEEYGLAITVGRQLGVLENLFTYDGRPGHEIVLVFEAELAHAGDYAAERRPCLDQPLVTGVWRSLSEDAVPLYPDGLAALIGPVATGRIARHP
ncbi:NUDIX hydrolase [Cellulomonas sp. S1-8]|uniref:NUDIX hydrolase n=1 Tax=Cellulomonas sp. S1-8 TaxID=2904790 RepID=UPI002243047D|nr:NUDIX domain-containing protein [Cellulomonas sp. S1-8]UZN03365.1 NUDIX domain-containing protein [Cellulomonas sp. S1-8]